MARVQGQHPRVSLDGTEAGVTIESFKNGKRERIYRVKKNHFASAGLQIKTGGSLFLQTHHMYISEKKLANTSHGGALRRYLKATNRDDAST